MSRLSHRDVVARILDRWAGRWAHSWAYMHDRRGAERHSDQDLRAAIVGAWNAHDRVVRRRIMRVVRGLGLRQNDRRAIAGAFGSLAQPPEARLRGLAERRRRERARLGKRQGP